MADWVSDELNLEYQGVLGGSASAGLAGGPNLPRSTEVRGVIKVIRFTIEAATPNPAPGLAAGSIASGDRVILAELTPIQRLFYGKVFIGVGWGAATTLSIGKLDLNNSTNTDAVHYKAVTSIAAPGQFDLDTNMTEQVGADPIGDQTAGNLIPLFGSGPIKVTGTFAGTLNATGTIIGYIFVTEESN